MKTILLAGGVGTRLSETADCPKPMVKVRGKPILWHIMQLYSAHGFNEFVLALGYKSEVIKQYFFNFYPLNNDLSINLHSGETHKRNLQPWNVHLVDTGLNTQTYGRLRRLRQWIGRERIMMTYFAIDWPFKPSEISERDQNYTPFEHIHALC